MTSCTGYWNSNFCFIREVTQIFLYGQIRAGRNDKIKKKLILELRNILIKKSNLDKTQVWVYINELPPSQMIEYGEILPKAGQENKWFNSLSTRLKKKLLALGK
jgi:phenylpyruvate tautomerase PptA (4-oxalocrotonate tautomerase family)